jgi:hypothetical protein
MSMILLEPTNTIPHLNVGIKRRTISLTGFEQLQLRSGWCWLQRYAATGAFPMRYYPATDTVKSCRRCNPILPLAKSSGPRRHGDSGRSKQAVRCGLPVIRQLSGNNSSVVPKSFLPYPDR